MCDGINIKGSIDSSLLLNDFNIFITSGSGRSIFWNINNFKLIS